jgi:hypothetical protein
MSQTKDRLEELAEDWVNICDDVSKREGNHQLINNVKRFYPRTVPALHASEALLIDLLMKVQEFIPDIQQAEQADQAESDLLIQDRNQDYEDSV